MKTFEYMEKYEIPVVYEGEITFVYHWARSQYEAIQEIGLAIGEIVLEDKVKIL